jgi:hypothetical protein
MRLFIIAAVAALAAAFATPSAAQTPPRKTTTTVYHALTASDLDAMLAEAGYTNVERVSDKQVNVIAPDGFRFTLTQAVCDAEGQPEGCLGLSIQATWTIKASDVAPLRPAIDAFNVDYAMGKAIIMADYVLLDRYAITDGGVTLMHLRQEIGEFLNMTEVLERSMATVLE